MNRLAKDRHFSEAASWAADREQLRERSHRRAWILTWILAAVAVTEGLALIALMPLRTVVPYTIMVDRQTGFATTLDPGRPASLGNDEALTQSTLVQYVAAREGFSISSVRSDYRRVMSWSAGHAREIYARAMDQTNPESPFVLYPRSTTLEVQPRSVSELSEDSALVRFDVVRIDDGGRASPPMPYAAVVRYRFAPRVMSLEERLINPLGFEVSRYRRDPEVLADRPSVNGASPDQVPAAGPGIQPGAAM